MRLRFLAAMCAASTLDGVWPFKGRVAVKVRLARFGYMSGGGWSRDRFGVVWPRNWVGRMCVVALMKG